ncbi:tetratricopeptide repeat protein (macronuclear) [Tetrahymena thermophila SB210]|uniref:Tetratricopeptide repeat protein n=1 Tax=Tetrahymena thermophila (strain SB210) TaxID=312017 RepID=Q22SQ0_TETTS|nr:tetratricopeptide repeat protein [Tetrahymena thermophila SB210]EAR88325.2 tetratricopeptide repeat protein [Tetrahymena thermophila SB210]|eukprot:XP_001008570.2 tetratricopeptide repeat protein [Tetrahymena thermophila SB210]
MIKDKKENILSQCNNNLQSNQDIITQNLVTQTQYGSHENLEQQIKINSKEELSQINFLSQESDLTIQRGLKSKIEKFSKSRLFSSDICSIVNQEKQQIAIISTVETQLNCSNPSQEKCIPSQQRELTILTKTNKDQQQLVHQDDGCDTQLKSKIYSIKENQQIRPLKIQSNQQGSQNQQNNQVDYAQVLQKDQAQVKTYQREGESKTAQTQKQVGNNEISQKIVNIVNEDLMQQFSSQAYKDQIKDKEQFDNTNNHPIKFENKGGLEEACFTNLSDKFQDEEIKNITRDSYITNQSISQNVLITSEKIKEEQIPLMQGETQGLSDYGINNQQYESLIDQLSYLKHNELTSLKKQYEEYRFEGYEQKQYDRDEYTGVIQEREWKQEVFDAINKGVFKNNNFEKQKSDIIDQLKNQNLYICKLLQSSKKGDLFIGYEELDIAQYNDHLIKISYKQTEKELERDISILQALRLNNYQHFEVEWNNTYIQVLPLSECQLVELKLKNFLMEALPKLNFSKIGRYLEIIIKNNQFFKEEKVRKQIDFLFSFLKDQKYYLCEFYDQDIKGIQLSVNYSQIIRSFQDFILNAIFGLNLVKENQQFLLTSKFHKKNDFKNIKLDKKNYYKYKKRFQQRYQQFLKRKKNEFFSSKQIKIISLNNQDCIIDKISQKEQEDLSKKSDDDSNNQGKQNESDLEHKKKIIFINNLDQSSQINDEVIQEYYFSEIQDFLKQNDILEQINEYNFKVYQNEQYKYQEYEKNEIRNYNVRQWSKKLFEIENQKLVFNEQLLSQQKSILKILKNKQYYLCKCFESNENKTTFIGYKQLSKEYYEDYIFIIKQKPTESEIKEYDIIREFKEEVNLFILPTNEIHIFILKRDVYIQYYNIFSKLKPMIGWSKEQFNQKNDKILNQKNCNQCNECKQGQECYYYYVFEEFKQNQDIIFQKLEEKQYRLTKYLNKGGCGLIFEGYKNSLVEYQELAFKILFNEDAQTELNIMGLFEMHEYVVKTIDHIKINETIDVLVLEKCECSLQEELQKIQKERNFPREKLCKMINQLIDGLIQFRIYNIVHLDIKPANILISRYGDYLFTDFGISSIKNKKQQQIEIKGHTKAYASPEQIEAINSKSGFSTETNFQSDIYSLGKTYQKIIEYYESVQPDDKKVIAGFKDIIQNHMLQKNPNDRKNCLDLHQLLLEKILEIGCFEVETNISQIDKLEDFNFKKEACLFQEIKIQYYQNYLNVLQKYSAQNLDEIQKTAVNLNIALAYKLIGFCFYNLNKYQNALQYLLLSLNLIKQYPEPISLASFHYAIASCFLILGDYQNALDNYQESLKMLSQVFNKGHPNIAKNLRKIGICLIYLGQYQKALEYTEKSLQMTKDVFVENHIDIANSLDNAGECYYYFGDNQKALEYLQQSLKIKRQFYKENHISIAETLNLIGLCYIQFDQNEIALNFLLEALEIEQSLIEIKNNQSVANYMNSIGTCYQYLGHYQKALDYYEKSLNIRRQLFQKNHPNIAQSLNNIGNYYYIKGEYKKSLNYLLESLEIRKQLFKEDHPDIAHSLNTISQILRKLGCNYKSLLEESLKINRKFLKQNHPEIARCLNNLGFFYLDSGNDQKALEYFRESLKIYKQQFKKDNSQIATILNNIGLCYFQTKNYLKALKYYQKSLKLSKSIENQDLAISLFNIASCYEKIGNYKKALIYFIESLEVMKKITLYYHSITALILKKILSCYKDLKDEEMMKQYVSEYLLLEIFLNNKPQN